MAEKEKNEKKQEKSKVRKAANKDESSITFYMHASFFLFFLTTYTFLLFLYKNKYPLILNNEILSEVLFACFGLLVFSFLSLFLLSFWRFLARVFIAIVAGGAVAYVLGLLYPFNIGNYFAHYVSFLPSNILMYLADNGNQIIAVIAGLFFFILLNMFKGNAMAFLSLPVLAAIFLLLNTASKQTIPEKIKTADAITDRSQEKDENLIYLLLSDHTGYGFAVESWQQLNSQNPNPKALPFSPFFISTFYRSNNFTFYPSVYLRYLDKYRNIGNMLNPSLTEIGNDLFNRNDAVYYVSSEDTMVSATRNDLFKALKEKGYHLNVYQSYPFDFCADAGAKEIANCVTYPAPLGALYQTNMSTPARLLLLAGHWLYSTPFGRQTAKFIHDKVQQKINPTAFPLLGNPMSKSLPVGQPLVLSHLRRDVLNAKGKNVFFTHLNLPHYPYVYDKNCRLRLDPAAWRSKAPYTDKKELNGELRRWEDYNQQLFCTYAQINYLIKELKTAKLLNKTTIVIHGDKGADIHKEKVEEAALSRSDSMLVRFQNNMTTVFGVYTPGNKAKTETSACDVATLISRHVLGNAEDVCQPPDLSSFTKEEQNKAMAWLSFPIPENYMQTADFEPLYSEWLEKGGQAYMASLDERLKQSAENSASSKISFVAPPSFMDNAAKQKAAPVVREKTTDFIPVPQDEEPAASKAEEKTETSEPAKTETPDLKKEEESTLSDPDDLLKTKTSPAEKTAQPAAKKSAEKAASKSASKTTSKSASGKSAAKKKTESPAENVVADDFGELPKPIVLPKSSAEDKWKSTDIKKGQTTSLELLPEQAREAQPAALPEIAPESGLAVLPDDLSEPPPPQAAPAAQIEILPLPVLETETASAPEQPVTATVAPEQKETESVKAAPETSAVTTEENKAIVEAEAQIKAAQDAKAKAETVIREREAKAKTKADAEAKAKAREKAKAEAKAKAEEAARLKAEAKAKAEAEAKAKAEETARRKAEKEAKAKAEAQERARIRAAEKAARLKAEEEERRKAEEAEREEMRKKTPPPPPANADDLDIIKETTVERVNEDGEIETFIYLERKPNPNRFKKKGTKERDLQQQDLTHTPEETKAPVITPPPAEPSPAAPNPAPEQQQWDQQQWQQPKWEQQQPAAPNPVPEQQQWDQQQWQQPQWQQQQPAAPNPVPEQQQWNQQQWQQPQWEQQQPAAPNPAPVHQQWDQQQWQQPQWEQQQPAAPNPAPEQQQWNQQQWQQPRWDQQGNSAPQGNNAYDPPPASPQNNIVERVLED